MSKSVILHELRTVKDWMSQAAFDYFYAYDCFRVGYKQQTVQMLMQLLSYYDAKISQETFERTKEYREIPDYILAHCNWKANQLERTLQRKYVLIDTFINYRLSDCGFMLECVMYNKFTRQLVFQQFILYKKPYIIPWLS